MHLVFLNQYYPPDAAPTGVVLRDLADAMARNGHEVTILCAEGGYAGEKFASVQCSVFSEEGESEKRGTKLAEETRSKVESQKSEVEETTASPPIQNSKLVPAQHCGDGSKIQNSAPTILRIRAFRFGRGSSIGKLLDYLSYYVGVSWKLMVMQPRPDRIVALTTPPYLSVLARAASRLRGADHAHWVMDLYPDVMVAHGMLAKESHAHRILAGLTSWGFGGRRCAAVVTLGPDMAERVGKHLNGPSTINNQQSTINNRQSTPISWVPLWGTGDRDAEDGRRSAEKSAAALRAKRGWHSDELVVMYSGNMGLGHRFGEILAAARELSGYSGRDQEGRPRMAADGISKQAAEKRTRIVFFGGGKRRAEVIEFLGDHPDCGVELHDYAPADILTEHLESADVHLVSLNAEWTGTMVPSKLQGIFAVGRPVIFIGSERSCIAQWLRESGAGWVVKPGDVPGLLAALHEARDSNERSLRGKAALAYAKDHFAKDLNASRVADIYESIAQRHYTKV